jgi:hypothetical protein
MSDDLPQSQMHAFNHAPAALRIFRFAADTAPRVLELAHVSAFLRECAVEFGSADATLPGAMRCEYAAKRFKLRAVVERNAELCPWLAEKLLACRSGAPIPAAALAPDVTRHDVSWRVAGARRNKCLEVSDDGSALKLADGEETPGILEDEMGPGHKNSPASGAFLMLDGVFLYGTAPLVSNQLVKGAAP